MHIYICAIYSIENGKEYSTKYNKIESNIELLSIEAMAIFSACKTFLIVLQLAIYTDKSNSGYYSWSGLSPLGDHSAVPLWKP